MNVGHQQFWLAGSRVYFQRDPIDIAGTPTVQPILDFGRVGDVNPAITTGEAVLKDADGGYLRTIARAMNEVDETYEVTFSNLNPDMLALLFMANPPTNFTQAATPITANHYAAPGQFVKLVNTSGAYVYGVTAVTNVGSGLVEGTDWEVVSLERGIIRMKDAWAGPAGNISITYTPRAITGLRLINPQTAGACASVTGTALIVWSRCGNKQQTVREARMQITPTGATFGVADWSSGTLRLSVLTDPTLPIPAGRLLYWVGNMPTAG